MKWALLLLFWLTVVDATGLTGAYERIFFYQVYRIAVATWGKDQDKFLPASDRGSCGALGPKGCDFNQFLTFLNTQSVVTDIPEPTAANMDEVARSLPNAETRYVSTWKLIPTVRNYPDLIKAAVDVMRDAHAVQVQNNNDKQIFQMEELARKSVNTILSRRRADQTPHLVQAIAEKWPPVPQNGETPDQAKERSIKLYPSAWNDMDGEFDGDGVDWKATMKEYPAGTFGNKGGSLKTFVEGFGRYEAPANPADEPDWKKSAREHEEVRRAWDGEKIRIQTSSISKCGKK